MKQRGPITFLWNIGIQFAWINTISNFFLPELPEQKQIARMPRIQWQSGPQADILEVPTQHNRTACTFFLAKGTGKCTEEYITEAKLWKQDPLARRSIWCQHPCSATFCGFCCVTFWKWQFDLLFRLLNKALRKNYIYYNAKWAPLTNLHGITGSHFSKTRQI